jgi:hypothetical protein
VTSPDRDDDFAGMLRRVKESSGADTPSPVGSREPPPVKKKAEGTQFVSWFGLVAIAGVLVLGVIGLASLSTWIARRMVAQGASRDNPALRRNQLQRERLTRFVVPADTTITPLEAGKLLHAIGNAGADTLRRWEQEPSMKFAAPPGPQWRREASRLFPTPGGWHVGVFAAVRRGLSAEQRAVLRSGARAASLDAFRRVASARGADLGAVWSVPADAQVIWSELPSVRGSGLASAAQAAVAAAALDLADGRAASSERRLREVVSVGFLYQESARSPLEEAIANTIIQLGRVGLEGFYGAVGRADDAAFASAKSDPQIPISHANRRVRVEELEATLERRIRDTTELTGIRWQLLLGPYTYLPCTSVRQAIFGPNKRYRDALAEFQKALTKYPSDERRLTMNVRGVPQMIDPWVGFRQRNTERPAWAGFAYTITRSRQLERCATLFRR